MPFSCYEKVSEKKYVTKKYRFVAQDGVDGSFSFADLAAGSYELQVAKPEVGIQATRRVEAPAADLLVQLGPTITLHGRVFDAASHAPVRRFEVTLGPASPGAEVNDFSGERGHQFDATAGAFVMEDVPVGLSTLVVSADGYRATTIEGISGDADASGSELEVAKIEL